MIKDILENNQKIQSNTRLLQTLKEYLPQFFDVRGHFKTDKFENEIKVNNISEAKDGYRLGFVGKDYARLQTGQESETVIIPDHEHNTRPENAQSQNVFITGDNLEALRHLQNAYTGKIKMIYIDPPYNTGSDGFVYHDKFEFDDEKLKNILDYSDPEIERLKSIQGKSSHSAWLTFMYPRLKLAQRLLTDDGVIFVSIDDNEQANLKLLMDDIFGEGNFRNSISVKRGTKSVQAQFENIDKLGIAYEYILLYSKNPNTKLNHFYFDLEEKKAGTWNNHWRGTDRPTMRYELFGIIPETGQWRWAKERSLKAIENYKSMLVELKNNNPTQEEIDNWYFNQSEEVDLLRLSNNNKPEHYISSTDKKFGNNLWTDLQVNGTYELESIELSLFDNPKNSLLIERMLKWITDKNSLILDFFAGSSTTAHAVMQLNTEDGGNRKYIMVQWDEPTNHESEARKAGYNTIDEISRERIKRAVAKIKSESPLFAETGDWGFKHYRLIRPETKTIDKILDFDPSKFQLFAEDMISPFAYKGTQTSGLETILQTWLIRDGFPFDTQVQEIKLAAYHAHYVAESATLYLIQTGFTHEALKDLLNRIGNHELIVNTLVVYPYSFAFEQMRELKYNLKTNVEIPITVIERY